MTVGAVFAGGLGKRLHPLTERVPKVMVEIENKTPLLSFNLEKMKNAGIERVFLMVGHLGYEVEKYYGKNWKGIGLEYLVEDEPMGTLWAVSNLLKHIDNSPFLLINGDVVSDIDFGELISHAEGNEFPVNLVHTGMPSPYGILEIRNAMVVRIREKPILDIPINAGIYHIKPEAFPYFKRSYDSKYIEDTALSALVNEGKVRGFAHSGFHCSLESMKDLERIKDWLSKKK
ncbi:MAG: nucleotidyltransferase family protein [Thermoplasmatota archaeon]